MAQNKFLSDFMRTQARLIESVQPEPVERDMKGRKKSKNGTASGGPAFPEGDAFQVLCSEKPNKKKVLEYFRNRIAQLVAAEEF
jgi:hypothetical protein